MRPHLSLERFAAILAAAGANALGACGGSSPPHPVTAHEVAPMAARQNQESAGIAAADHAPSAPSVSVASTGTSTVAPTETQAAGSHPSSEGVNPDAAAIPPVAKAAPKKAAAPKASNAEASCGAGTCGGDAKKKIL